MPAALDLAPMLATAGSPPADARGWAVEFKWDGVRALAQASAEELIVVGRRGNAITSGYPELKALCEAVAGHQVVLDGEIVSLNRAGRPDFGQLQSRIHVARPTAALLRGVPVAYFVFDLLGLDGECLLAQPYRVRRERLAELGLSSPPPVRVPDYHDDLPPDQLLRIAVEHELEGIVCKRLESHYRPGARSRDWIKTPVLRAQEVIIGGWQPGEGRRAGTLGSLLVGVPGGEGLHYAGHVGTGFSDAHLRELQRQLDERAQRHSPFADPVPREHARNAHWVRPELVGEVAYRQWTRDGRLRAPVWRGLRPDKRPDEVIAREVIPS